MRPWAVLVLLALSGCAGSGPQPSTPTTSTPSPTSEEGTLFFADPADPGLPAPYDFLNARWREENATLILRLEFRNFTGGQLPAFVARFRVEDTNGTRELFVRDRGDSTLPDAPYLRFELGRTISGTDEVTQEVYCARASAYHPWIMEFELPHNHTMLVGGGTITHMRVNTSDFESHDQDLAEANGSFRVQGGTPFHKACAHLVHKDN